MPLPLSAAPPRPARVHVLSLAGADDASLVRATREGHANAAAIVWDRFAPMVRGILRRGVGPGSDVDDLMQTVFLLLFSRIGELRDPSALRSFIFGIAVHTARGELRRRRLRRWFRLSDTGAVPDEAAPDVDPDAREALMRLHAILNRVDDEGRLAFVLRHVEGLELTEVAEALGVSLATAKRRLTRVVPRVMTLVARDPLLVDYLDHGPTHRSPLSPREAP